jgi:hypothetical protein
MQNVITNILTTPAARDGAVVEKTLYQESEILAPWAGRQEL